MLPKNFALVLPFFLALTTPLTGGQEIEDQDVPQSCRAVCLSSLINSRRCENDDDDVELNCTCSAANAETDIPNCEACVAEYDEADNGMS